LGEYQPSDNGGKEMIQVEEHEAIRRSYFVEGKPIRQIARELRHGRELVRRVIASPEPARYTLQEPREAPVLGPYKARIQELVAESRRMPRKQRYTGDKIFEIIQQEGYQGAASTVRGYVAQCRQDLHRPKVFLPLEFEPGQDAQVDWGEAFVYLAGQKITVQVFVMRLNYSRVRFVMAFPFQKQEAFFEGHVQAFHFFGAVPRRISYDNLKTAVYRILEGRKRQEQERFVTFRSYYLFESFFCTPGKGNEKGGVESDMGFCRRNFLVPLPRVDSFEELNAHLRQECLDATQRRIRGQPTNIAGAWERERPHLLPLPERDFPCCVSRPVKANSYSQVTYETNRYSVPPAYAGRQLVLRAFPFRIEVLHLDQVIVSHPRCFGREEDVLDPLHYLEILEQRPGAFDYTAPMKRWRERWPPVYETLLEQLREKWPEGRGVREFIRILRLHREYKADLIEKAVRQALDIGCAHFDGVSLCLRRIDQPEEMPGLLDLQEFPGLIEVGKQPVDLGVYDQLLAGR
jgi:transposase